MKKEFVKEPRNLIVIVSKKVTGYIPNSEKLMKDLHLPFKLDLTKTDVRLVGVDDLPKINMDNLKAVIVNTPSKPCSIIEFFQVRNLDPLLHYTAVAYKAMTEDEKELWRNLELSKKLSPSTYVKA